MKTTRRPLIKKYAVGKLSRILLFSAGLFSLMFCKGKIYEPMLPKRLEK